MGLTGPLRLAGYTAILRVWAHRVRYATPLVAVLLVSIVALVAGWAEPRFVVPTAQFCALAGMVLLWAGFFAAVQRQNHPLPARLLPGQLRCLREVTVLGFLAVVLPSAWLLATSPLQVPGPAALILSALACLLLAFIVRWPWLWVVGWVVASMASAWVPREVKGAVKTRMLEIYGDQPVSMAAFLMVMVALALWHLFQPGGPRHAKSWKRQSQMRDLLKPQGSLAGQEARSEGWTFRLMDWCFRAFSLLRVLWMDWLIRHARPTARSALARAELVASPQSHWTSMIGALLVVFPVTLTGFAVTLQLNPDSWAVLGNGLLGSSWSYLAMLLGMHLATASGLRRRRREQALLLLLPGMPRGVALNRQLAARQMATHALNWLLAVALMLGLQARAGQLNGADAEGPGLGRIAVMLAAVVLPMGVAQWRNWAVQPESPPLWIVALGSLVATATMAMAVWYCDRHDLPLYVLLVGSVAVTVVLMAVRWPLINRYPSFWPVGRDA